MLSENKYTDYRHLYLTPRWKKLRKRVFARDGWQCVYCRDKGIVTPAQECDHRVPLIRAPELFWEENNLDSVCTECHLKKTADERREQTNEKKRVPFDIATGRPVTGRNS